MPQKLSSNQVAALSADGDHYVDRNLRLQIRDGGATRSWIFRYQLNGRLRRMGLGSYRLVKYTNALRRSIDAQKLLNDGIDPMGKRDAERPAVTMTFAECAKAYIEANRAGWSNAKHAYQWTQSIETYANPVLGSLPVDQVDANGIVKALEPIWATKSETADRLRSRIERVLDWARVSGHRSGDNPAKWRGELEHRLPPLSRVQVVENYVAIPYADAPTVFEKLGAIDTTSAKALRFVMLTAMRVGAVLGATWQEFDLEAEMPLWSIPAERMKMRRPHRVPLNIVMIGLLKSLRKLDSKPTDLVFNSQVRGRKLSDTNIRKLLRKVSVADADTHGLRSTFRDWCAERTSYPPLVAEAALAHILGTKVETAYLRTDLLNQRAKLMTDWAGHLEGF